MWTKTWWYKVLDRMTRAAAYSFIAITAGDVNNVLTIETAGRLQVVASAAILSFVGSIITTKAYGDKDDPSLT